MSSKTETLNLDADLEELAAAAVAAREQAEEQVESEMAATNIGAQEHLHNQIIALLRSEPNSPTTEHLSAWKERFGENAIYLLGLGPGDAYVYTALTLGQWEKIQLIAEQAQGTPQAQNIEKLLKEKVIRSTCLWPKLEADFFQRCRAGVPETLYQAILLNSYFLTPQQTMSLSIQL